MVVREYVGHIIIVYIGTYVQIVILCIGRLVYDLQYSNI